MKFTVSELSASLGAPASGDADLTGVAVDSRRVGPGDLFVAIRGARVDGHDFASRAAAAGARALLAERRPDDVPAGFPVVLVRDVVAALRRFASTLKRRMGFRLAAITGSAGKTTTKEFAAAILARRFAVAKTPGNQNSQIGFPMSVVNLPDSPARVAGGRDGAVGAGRPGHALARVRAGRGRAPAGGARAPAVLLLDGGARGREGRDPGGAQAGRDLRRQRRRPARGRDRGALPRPRAPLRPDGAARTSPRAESSRGRAGAGSAS